MSLIKRLVRVFRKRKSRISDRPYASVLAHEIFYERETRDDPARLRRVMNNKSLLN